MAVQSKVGSFDISLSTGNQSVTGVGFQPKAVLFFHRGRPGFETGIKQTSGGFGFAVSPSEQYSVAYFSRGDVNPSSCASRVDNANVYSSVGGDGFPHYVRQTASLVSFDVDGFTINVSTASRNDTVFYIAFGGVDFDAKVGLVNLTANATPNSVTGVGFGSDLLLFFASGLHNSLNTIVQDMSGMMGFHDGTGNYASSMYRDHNSAPQGSGVRGGNEVTDAPIMMQDMTGSVYLKATASITSDGFTITKSIVPAAEQTVMYVAIKGFQTLMGSFLADEANLGTKSITGVGFTPSLTMFFSDYLNSSIIGQYGNRMNFGAQGAVGTGEARSVSWTGTDNNNPEVADEGLLRNNRSFSARAPASVIEGFYVQSYDVDGFTIYNEEKNTGFFPASTVNFIAFIEGTNNNGIEEPEPETSECLSGFGIGLSDYGVLGLSTHPDAHKIGSCCFVLSDTEETEHIIGYDISDDAQEYIFVANLLVIGDLASVIENTTTLDIYVETSDDDFATTEESELFSLTSADLIGPYSRDYAVFLDSSIFNTYRRYWRVRLVTPIATRITLRGVSLGKALRFSRSPASLSMRLDDTSTEVGKNPWLLTLQYQALTQDNKQDVANRLVRHHGYSPLWLFDSDDSVILHNKLFKATLVDYDAKIRRNGVDYDVTLTFEELL